MALGLGSRPPLSNPELLNKYVDRHFKEMDEVMSLAEKDPPSERTHRNWDQATRDKFDGG